MNHYRHHRSFALPPAAIEVPALRAKVTGTLTEWGVHHDDERLHAVGLITTELVTNAVMHAGKVTPRILVALRVGQDGALELSIRDRYRVRPQRLDPSGNAACGRGMTIVDVLLTELGGLLHTEPHPDGKTVSVRLPGLLP